MMTENNTVLGRGQPHAGGDGRALRDQVDIDTAYASTSGARDALGAPAWGRPDHAQTGLR
jgi:hypothetical protein